MYSSQLRRNSNARQSFKLAVTVSPLLILAFAISCLGQADPPIATGRSNAAHNSTSFPNVTIKNFGQMSPNFFRGAQPKHDEYTQLADLGVKAIIDLRDDPASFAKSAAEAAHMRYFNIPMSDTEYPKQEAIDEFLKITKDPTNGPFYVHCAGGRHRTGLMGAVYRFNYDGWDYAKAYQEMKQYDYYSRWGHGVIKKYVREYWQRFHADTGHSDSIIVQTKQ